MISTQIKLRWIICIVAMAYFYVGTGGFKSRYWPNENYRTYYSDLSDSFWHGKLYIGTTADDHLKATDGWDLSLYKEKYYLYFGVVPVLTAYLPLRLITFGKVKMTNAWSVILFSFGCFLLGLAFLKFFRDRYFQCSEWVFLFCVFLFAFANGVLLELRRPVMYQEAITSAAFFFYLGIWAFLKYLSAPRLRMLTFSSLAFALAVGSRPTAIFPSIIVLVFMSWILRKEKKWIALYLPFAVGLFLLGIYNYLRFDSFTEFGFHYVTTTVPTANTAALSIERLFPGLYFNLFQRPYAWDQFPFLRLHLSPAVWFGLPSPYGIESPVGLFFFSPIMLLLPLSVFFLKKRSGSFSSNLLHPKIFFSIFLVCGICSLFVISLFVTSIDRFFFDFSPAFMLVTCFLWMYFDAIEIKKRFFNAVFLTLGLSTFYMHFFVMTARFSGN